MPHRDDDEQPEQFDPPGLPIDPGEVTERVGYKRPPKHTRFAKGQSGNPAGRPKGSLNRATIRAMVESVWLEETVKIIEAGRERHIPRLNALMKKQAELAFKGDPKVIKDCFDLLLRVTSDAPEPRSAEETADEDMAILCTHGVGAPDTANSPEREEDDRA